MSDIKHHQHRVIPQHPLISQAQWDRLRRDQISHWTYWSVIGPVIYRDGSTGYKNVEPFVITKKDVPS